MRSGLLVKRDNTNSVKHLKLNRFVVHICRRLCSFATKKRRNAVSSTAQEDILPESVQPQTAGNSVDSNPNVSDEAFTILSRGWR